MTAQHLGFAAASRGNIDDLFHLVDYVVDAWDVAVSIGIPIAFASEVHRNGVLPSPDDE